MGKSTDYKINKVEVSTNGRNEIIFIIEWEGNKNIDNYELRVWESDKTSVLDNIRTMLVVCCPQHNIL